ncbi:MAG: M48 family metallopeptidase [Verrucomicrobiales bacterium]
MDIEPNAFFWIILAAVLGAYLLDLIAERLNLRALNPKLPAEFAGVFDADDYAKSQRYTREGARFGLIESTFSLALFLGFWLLGGFPWLDGLVGKLGWGPVASGLVFMAVLYLANFALHLPFTIYDTFVIEEKFGFNRTTRKTFAADQVKGLLLAAVFGLPIVALLLWLFGTFPNAWLWGWIAVAAYSLVVAYLGPRLILPLFNKFEPLADGELKDGIHAMADKCGFPLREVSVMDGSKRSSKSNAFFTGFGKNKKIALFDTLVDRHTAPELIAVLAHEIGHFKKRHIVQGMVIGILQAGVLFYLLSLFLENESLSAAFGVAPPKVYLSFIFFGLLYKPVSLVLGIALSALSRKNEFEADAYAAQVTGDPGSMVDALKKLSKDNLANLTPHPFYVFLNYSHPPMLERIAALRKAAA